LKQILNEWKTLLSVVLIPYRFGGAKLDPGLSPRLGEGHARVQILFDLEREMFGDLFAQALVVAPPGCEVDRAYQEATQEFHTRSSALTLKKRVMTAAVCFQSRAPDFNCWRLAATAGLEWHKQWRDPPARRLK
jgi:hypothetical protein